MRYYRIRNDGQQSVVAQKSDEMYDLTAVDGGPSSFSDLGDAAKLQGIPINDLVGQIISRAPTLSVRQIQEEAIRPIDPAEVWEAGVTYAISQEARQDEGGLAESYLNAYEADRPEVYFKATPSRTVGPNESVGIRSDSDWDVPEPELTIVLFDGEIVGYTIGNDVCSRDIERENLLYLPQSKIYTNSCAIGPCIATPDTVDDPHDLELILQIRRDEEVIFEDQTSTIEMVRHCEELVAYLKRCNDLPQLTVLLTGTSIIPPDHVTLRQGDHVSIDIEKIGTLENPVEEIPE